MEEQRKTAFEWFMSQAFGSDELTPYSAEYAWNSNQMSHTMMGFCLAACWILFAVSLKPKAAPAPPNGAPAPEPPPVEPVRPRWALFRLLAWLWSLPLDVFVLALFATIPLKELADLLLDGANYANSPVKPNTGRLLFDSATDTAFWWTGMFLAAAIIGGFLRGAYRAVVPTVGLVACVAFWYFWAAPLWLNQKRTFDKSGMPFNYTRLAVLAGERDGPRKVAFVPGSSTQWADLEAFRGGVVDDPEPQQRHYVLFGGHPDTRSRLAVSMGCEFAFKIRRGDTAATGDDLVRVRYISAATALERPKLLEENSTLKRLECVIVDALDVSTVRPSEVATTYLAIKQQEAEKSPTKKAPVSARVLEKVGSGKWVTGKPPSGASKGNTVELDAGQIAAIGAGAADGPLRLPPPSTARDERLQAINDLGAKARNARVSTIWVLTGHDGGKDTRAHAEWERRKRAWIEEIADILDVEPAALKLIELAEPTTR